MADQVKLPYLNAAIQELQRIAVLLPINFCRELLSDVQIGEYKFKKGTDFLPQFNSVHLDDDEFPSTQKIETKDTFLDPNTLIPERHLDENGAFKKDDRITPFSVG